MVTATTHGKIGYFVIQVQKRLEKHSDRFFDAKYCAKNAYVTIANKQRGGLMDFLYGRHVTQSELSKNQQQQLEASQHKGTPALRVVDGTLQCQRCGTNINANWVLPQYADVQNVSYCRNCLTMTRLTSLCCLYHLPEPNAFKDRPQCIWNGKLSSAQQEVAVCLQQALETQQQYLIWAVTGAGKTEILFPTLTQWLQKRARIAIVSPRVDVVLELAPRIVSAFSNVTVSVLYGGADPYRYTQLVIATTHQMWRFLQAFDLIIVDEVDAFPFHQDETLHHAVTKALKPDGSLVYLTATPDAAMRHKIEQHQLCAATLPARYHRHALPEPHCEWVGDWRQAILQQRQHSRIFKVIDTFLARKRRFLIFMPNIQLMHQLEILLRERLPEHWRFASVHAQDAQRSNKVQELRSEQYDFLLTTTILERGVTFPNIDVLVIGAEDPTFTTASLVQIAGRVGRKAEYPTGHLCFAVYGKTTALIHACQQIKAMNQLARRRGLIDD